MSAGSKFGSAFKGALSAAGTVAAAVGIVKAVKDVFETGLSFEKTTNKLQAVTGATAQQMDLLRRKARELGNDVSLTGASASDAMTAMTELAKAGFSVDDAMTAARGTLQLASAAQISAGEAAEIQSNALLAFGLQANDAGRAADVLANAANASSAEITDVAYAFQAGSSVASQFGISMEDTATAIAMMANVGIKGSDAGTLLKSTLLALASPSEQASVALGELGVDAWDANGKFVGLGAVFEQLQDASERMTPEMYAMATSTAFGSDAARLAGVAAKTGAEGFDAMGVNIRKSGSAAEVAAAQTQGLPGVMERLSNTAEGAKLSLMDMSDGVLVAFGDKFNNALSGAVDWFNSHKPEIIDFFVSIGDAAIKVLSTIQQYVANTIGAVGELTDYMVPLMRGWANIDDFFGLRDSKEADDLRKGADALEHFGDIAPELKKKVEDGRKSWDDWKKSLDEAGEQAANNERILRVLGDSFVEVNDKGEIKLKDNTPEVIDRLRLMDVTLTTLPEGEVILKPNTPEAQKIVDDFIKTNNPTAPLTAPLHLDTEPAKREFMDVYKDFLSGGGIGGSAGGGLGGSGGVPMPSFSMPGTAGKGYMNSKAASDWLDARGASYGLPGGTNTGGYGTGTAATFPDWVMNIARAFGISPGTYAGHQEDDRHESGYAPNPNGQNRGIDWTGPVENLQKFADYLAQMPQALEQVIWENPTTHQKTGIGGGQINPGYYPQSTYDEHGGNDPGNIHVHTRQSSPIPLPFSTYDNGGGLPPGITVANNETGKTEYVLTNEQMEQLRSLGIDPAKIDGNTTTANGGPSSDQLADVQGLGISPASKADKSSDSSQDDPMSDFLRTAGFVPTNAGNTGVAGTSSLAAILNMGNQAIGGLIDTGASLAQMAVQAGITAGTFGAGAAAGPAAGAAAGFGIQLGATELKRGVSYGFQMASIGADSLIEQIFPFGAPRWLGYDYTQFAPQLNIQQAMTSSVEKAGGQAINQAFGLDQNGQKIAPGAQPQPGGAPAGGVPHGPQGPPPPSAPDPFGTHGPAPGPTTAPLPQDDILAQLGVYDTGGELNPGQLALNASRTPEKVLTQSQWDAMASAAAQPPAESGGYYDYRFMPASVVVKDVKELQRQIDDRQQLATMRYRGRPSQG